MSSPFKCVLLIGATAGIGKALADRLVEGGSKVIAVGRRKDRLDEFVSQHGSEVAFAAPFDIADKERIPQFAAEIVEKYPDLDCVFLNAGVQRQYDLTDPNKFDLDAFHQELNVNFSSFVNLTHAFLPLLLGKSPSPTNIVYTTSHLALIPAAPMPAYSASKAALTAFIHCLREQLRGSSVKITEILPPAVQTELHDYMGVEVGRKVGMPLDQFTAAAWAGLTSGDEEIYVGVPMAVVASDYQELVKRRRRVITGLTNMLLGRT